jgi:ketosteroid isomerase-like protein
MTVRSKSARWMQSLVLAAAVLVPAAIRAEEMSAQAKALAKLDDDWSKAAVARDVAKVVSFYAEDAVAYPPGAPVAVGKAAAGKVWGAYFADPSFSISWKTTRAAVSKSGDIGWTAGTYEDSYKGADGKVVREKGKYLCVWKKQKDGSWKAIQDMWNDDGK